MVKQTPRESGSDEASTLSGFVSGRALSRTMNRRQVLAGALGISLMGLLAACGGDDDDSSAPTATQSQSAAEPTATTASAPAATEEPAASPAADGPWEFTDGRGVTVSLPKRPERIVAFAAATGALWDFGVRPVGIFGVQRLADGSIEPTVGNADLDSMESIAETNDDIDIEALMALQPDLVISTLNTLDDVWGMQDPAILTLVEEVVPVLGMPAFFEPIGDLIGHFEELAEALGGDPQSAEISGYREAFEAASADIEAITAVKPDLTVLACAGNDENFFFASTELFPDLIYLKSLGVQFVEPAADIAFEGGPWGLMSWEQVGQYTPDVILADSRRGWPPPTFVGKPTYDGLSAVKAGQVGKWTPIVPLSYAGMALILDAHAELLREADESIA